MTRESELDSRIAIISDVHANMKALQKVLADIASKGIKRIINLGDSIGYGPDPRGCYEILFKSEKVEVHLLGNHDRAYITRFDHPEIALHHILASPRAYTAMEFTIPQMYGDHPLKIEDIDAYQKELLEKQIETVVNTIDVESPLIGLFHRKLTNEQKKEFTSEVVRQVLQKNTTMLEAHRKDLELLCLGREAYDNFKTLEPFHVEEMEGPDKKPIRVMYAHDNVVEPGNDKYTVDTKQRVLFPEAIQVSVSLEQTYKRAIDENIQFVFVGHLHHAKIYQVFPKRFKGIRAYNVGSVGFARHDEHNRATYTIFDPKAKQKPVEIVRLDYDWREVAKDMEEKGLKLPREFRENDAA